jgi:hypothetical protein
LDGGATPSSCLVAAVVPVTPAVPHRRAVNGCGLAGAAAMGTVRRPQRGHPRVMWWRMSDCLRRPSSPCPVSTCPDVQRSGVQDVRWIRVRVHVSGDGCTGVRSAVVRCPRVSCPPALSASALSAPWWVRGASWSRGQTALWVGRGRPAADRQPHSGGDHGSGWAPGGLAEQSAGVASSGEPSHGWKRRDAPGSHTGWMGFARSSGRIVWRRTRR